MSRLAKDVDLRLGWFQNGPWPAGFDAVLEIDDFDSGFSGWQSHTEYASGATAAYPPISLTNERTMGRSRHALMLSTSISRSDTVQKGGTNVSFKRSSRLPLQETGVTAVFFAWALRGVAEQASPARIKFDIDTQNWDESDRLYGSLQLRRFVSQAPDVWSPRWSIRDGAGIMDIPGAVPGNPTTPTVGSGTVFGFNENKAGFSWAGLGLDYETGNYAWAYTGAQFYNLSTLGANAHETSQNSGTGGTSFAGGDNVGAFIQNRGGTDDGHAKLFIGAVVKLHYPKGYVLP